MVILKKHKGKKSVVIMLLLLLGGCLVQVISTNPAEWDTYETIVNKHRKLTYKAPPGAKETFPLGENVETHVDLRVGDGYEQNPGVAWFGYEPGGDSSGISKFGIGLSFSQYTKNTNVESMEDLVDYLNQKGFPEGTYESINGRRWYHVVFYELDNPDSNRISGDSYITLYSKTHQLVAGASYAGKIRHNKEKMRVRRSILKSFVSEIKVE